MQLAISEERLYFNPLNKGLLLCPAHPIPVTCSEPVSHPLELGGGGGGDYTSIYMMVASFYHPCG